MQQQNKSVEFARYLPYAAAAIAIAIFVFDTVSPLHFAVAVLYVVVILIVASSCTLRGVVFAAIGCTILTLTSYALAHGLEWTGTAPIRSLMSLSAIAITTVLALRNLSTMQVTQEQAQLLDLSQDAIFVHDLSERIAYWNRGAEELYGWTSDEAIGREPRQLLKTIFPSSYEEIMTDLRTQGRWEGELDQTTRDGRRLTVSSRWALQRDSKGNAVRVFETNTDITEQKRADAALRASEKRYRSIFDAAGVALWEQDFTRVKRALDNIRNQGVTDFRAFIAENPGFVEHLKGLVHTIDVNDATVALFEAERRSDLLSSISTVVGEEGDGPFIDVIDLLFRNKPITQSESVLKTLKGGKVSVLFNFTLASDPAVMDRVLISMTDVTERNKIQEALNRATTELAHASRIATLGELTASIAHEVNQPLAAIVTNGEACLRWLKRDKPDLDEVRDNIDRMIANGNRAAEVIRRLRAMARKVDPDYEVLSLNDIVEQAVSLVEREVGAQEAKLKITLADPSPAVYGDRVQLQQVIINLILNAAQAMASVTDRSRVISVRTTRSPGEAWLEVADVGPGIDTEIAVRIFDPFFTTKHDGMGMGLSICRSIAEAHEGQLGVVETDDPGTVFRMTLRAVED